jgi:hypothetical protein
MWADAVKVEALTRIQLRSFSDEKQYVCEKSVAASSALRGIPG